MPGRARRDAASGWSASAATQRRRRRKADRERKRRGAADRKAEHRATLPAPPAPAGGLVEFAAALTVTQGDHEGELLTLLPWERDYLEAVEAAAGGELGLSVAAGAGKTTLVACIAAAAVAGPLARRRAAAVVVAGSFQQACLAFDTARAFLQDGTRSRRIRTGGGCSDRSQVALIQDRETGAELRAREASAPHPPRAGPGACDWR